MRIIVISIYDGGYCASICYHFTTTGYREIYVLDEFDVRDKSKLDRWPKPIFELACQARLGRYGEIKKILSSYGSKLFDLAFICSDGDIELLEGEKNDH